ncbi:3-keto-5-aminohexanoate cleavage protein [Candidatus Desulfarcum epimagneticum]|uniref:3-keto-5-aminohexanoate cleavage protein n=1 Tax=uncultured Desulfobacteraceae bacterium TaxID=218296 RepID=A0A484HLR7_9BACT|nr:3-keto-5-aminohexanoate cleavage protein [uncultured Desulfobacteraceae bacterium]
MSVSDKAVVTCALTGVLTDPAKFNVPVTPDEMAAAAAEAHDAGASILHCHFRDQRPGLGAFPTWDLQMVGDILDAIKERVPDILICMSTGVLGDDLSGPLACLEKFRPEMAACNAGSLNYLKIRGDGQWAWPPVLFDNPVEKIEKFLEVMTRCGVAPEFECFDTGIVRSVALFKASGMFEGDAHLSFVMGVDSGMPSSADLLPILEKELPENASWQVIATGTGREKIWRLHRRCLEMGGNVRTGLEDTFYLPDGARADSNGALVEALVKIVRETGREPASPAEARKALHL